MKFSILPFYILSFLLCCIFNKVGCIFKCPCLCCENENRQENVILVDFAAPIDHQGNEADGRITNCAIFPRENAETLENVTALHISNLTDSFTSNLTEVFTSQITFLKFSKCSFHEDEFKRWSFADLVNLEMLIVEDCNCSLETIHWLIEQFSQVACEKIRSIKIVGSSASFINSKSGIQDDLPTYFEITEVSSSEFSLPNCNISCDGICKEKVKLSFENFINLESLHLEMLHANCLDYNEIMKSVQNLQSLQRLSLPNNMIATLRVERFSTCAFHSIILDGNNISTKSLFEFFLLLENKSVQTFSCRGNMLQGYASIHTTLLEKVKKANIKFVDFHSNMSQINLLNSMNISCNILNVHANMLYPNDIVELKKVMFCKEVILNIDSFIPSRLDFLNDILNGLKFRKFSNSEIVQFRMIISFIPENFFTTFDIARDDESLKSTTLTENDFKKICEVALGKISYFDNAFNLSETNFIYEEFNFCKQSFESPFHFKFNFITESFKSDTNLTDSIYFEKIDGDIHFSCYLPLILENRMYPVFYTGMPDIIIFAEGKVTIDSLSIAKNVIMHLNPSNYDEFHSCSTFGKLFYTRKSLMTHVKDSATMKSYFAPLKKETNLFNQECIDFLLLECIDKLDSVKIPDVLQIFHENWRCLRTSGLSKIISVSAGDELMHRSLFFLSKDSSTFPVEIFKCKIVETTDLTFKKLHLSIAIIAEYQYLIKIPENHSSLKIIQRLSEFEIESNKVFYFFLIFFTNYNEEICAGKKQVAQPDIRLSDFICNFVVVDDVDFEKLPERNQFLHLGNQLLSCYNLSSNRELCDECCNSFNSYRIILSKTNAKCSHFKIHAAKVVFEWYNYEVVKKSIVFDCKHEKDILVIKKKTLLQQSEENNIQL